MYRQFLCRVNTVVLGKWAYPSCCHLLWFLKLCPHGALSSTLELKVRCRTGTNRKGGWNPNINILLSYLCMLFFLVCSLPPPPILFLSEYKPVGRTCLHFIYLYYVERVLINIVITPTSSPDTFLTFNSGNILHFVSWALTSEGCKRVLLWIPLSP